MKEFFKNVGSSVASSILPTPTTFVVLGLVFAIGAAGGWAVNGWRLNSEIADMKAVTAQANEQAEKDARAKEAIFTKKLQEATDAAKTREITLRADADRARTATERMRGTLEGIKQQLPDLAQSACVERASKLADVFGACVGRYQQLAEETDRHVNDKLMMQAAWPVQ